MNSDENGKIRKFKSEIRSSCDFFTIVVNIFRALNAQNYTELKGKYNSFFKHLEDKDREILKSLDNYAERSVSLIRCSNCNDWLSSWLAYSIESKIDFYLYCYITIIKIDCNIPESDFFNDIVVDKGPLGENDGYAFYFRKPSSIVSKKMEKNKIRRGRQTSEHNVNSINSDLNRFEVFYSPRNHKYIPKVIQYKSKDLLIPRISVGFVPIADECWFTEETNYDSLLMDVNYTDLESDKYMNSLNKQLAALDSKGVHIVIFPELAIHPKAIECLENVFSANKYKNIKLCFLGTSWIKKIPADCFQEESKDSINKIICTNESFLYSSNGTMLSRQSKKSPYKRFDKKINDYVTENIDTNDKTVTFVDVLGLGRIAYFICADINDRDIEELSIAMHTDFTVVSACTNSTDLMVKSAHDRAVRCGSITAVCNTCSKIEVNDSDGLASALVTPIMTLRKLSDSQIQSSARCEGGNCDKCIQITELS